MTEQLTQELKVGEVYECLIKHFYDYEKTVRGVYLGRIGRGQRMHGLLFREGEDSLPSLIKSSNVKFDGTRLKVEKPTMIYLRAEGEDEHYQLILRERKL